MDWNQSYSATWRVFRVNRQTWADGELIDNVDEATVTRTAGGEMLESGSLDVTGDFTTDYYRIVMTAEQGGEVERVDVATLLFEVQKEDIDYGVSTYKVDGHSVLYPAAKTTIVTGEYAPAGVDGVQYAKALLESAINAPVETEGSFTLNDHVVHEIGSSVLKAVWAVLDAGGYVIQIDGQGVVHIRPIPTEPALVLDNASAGLLLNGISREVDLSEVPNRYVVIDDDNITVATNDDPNSIISTVRRGYNVDMVDESPTLVNSETRGDYANRKLAENSVYKEESDYSREYAPDVYLYSLIRASIEGLGGDYRVESQTLNCNNGITLSEKVSREIRL